MVRPAANRSRVATITGIIRPMPPERDTELAANWIWRAHLRRFLELVSFYAGYRFADPGSGDEVSVQITGPPDRLLGARISGLMDAYQQPGTETSDGQD
jgi:hypothetical protein